MMAATLPRRVDGVEIDPAHPRHCRLSGSADSTRVAGVVTIRPGTGRGDTGPLAMRLMLR
jgi:hypothetical protein